MDVHMAHTYILMASPTQEQKYVHAYIRAYMCMCVSFQSVEVAKLLQHLLLTGLSYLPCQKHFIYNSIDLHQGEGKVDAVDRQVQE